jgi:hypothetical protein
MTANRPVKRNLDSINSKYVDIDNKSPLYLNITQIPTVFTAGVNTFKFKPTEFVSTKEQILIEILDKGQNPILTQILNYKEIDGTRVVSVEINNTIPSGKCTIFFIASILYTKGKVRIPKRFLNQNNYKYIHNITIDNTKENESDIIYTNAPVARMRETIYPIVEEKFTTQKGISITGTGIYTNIDGRPKLTATNGNFFPKNVTNGTIVFQQPSDNITPKITYTPIKFFYSSSIARIKTPLEIELSKELFLQGPQGQRTKVSRAYDQTYYIKYNKDASEKNITQNRKTYAVLDIDNLTPTTGDVSRIKVFAKSSSRPKSEYETLYDGEVEPRNVFVDTSPQALLIDNPIGMFDTDVTVNIFGTNQSASLSPASYWEAVSYNNAPPATPVTYSGYSFNSISYVPDYTLSDPQFILLQHKDTYKTIFYKDTEYSLKLDYFIENNQYDYRNPILEVYVSGSAFVNTTSIGKFLGRISEDNNQIRLRSNFSVPIKPDNTGDAVIRFKITDGVKLSNIRILEQVDIGFTPNRTRLYIPIRLDHKNEYLDFKIEFLNNTGKQSTTRLLLNNVLFRGGNTYIFGSDNLISGSTFLSSQTGSGINMASSVHGSTIKSNNYLGLESSKLSKDGFGWGLTYGNPYNSINYEALSRIDMINRVGSSFVFVSETGSNANDNSQLFNLYLIGNTSRLLIGSSQSLSGFGEGGSLIPSDCGNSFIRWNGCKIEIDNATNSTGDPYVSLTRLEDYTELKRAGFRFNSIPSNTNFVSNVLTMPTGNLINIVDNNNSVINGATPALTASVGSMFYDTKTKLPLLWTGEKWESLVPFNFRTSVFNHAPKDAPGGGALIRHKHNKDDWFPISQLIAEWDGGNVDPRNRVYVLTGEFPQLLADQSIVISPYSANDVSVRYLAPAEQPQICGCYQYLKDQLDDDQDPAVLYVYDERPNKTYYQFDGVNEFGYKVPAVSSSADNSALKSDEEEVLNPLTGRNIYLETMEICSASWAASESKWMGADTNLTRHKWMNNSRTLVVKI